MFDQRLTMNRQVRVRVKFQRGCLVNGTGFAEGAEASIDPLQAGLLVGQGAATLTDPADILALREAAATDYRDAERRFKRFEHGRP